MELELVASTRRGVVVYGSVNFNILQYIFATNNDQFINWSQNGGRCTTCFSALLYGRTGNGSRAVIHDSLTNMTRALLSPGEP